MSATSYKIGTVPVSLNEGYGDKALLITNTGSTVVYLSDVNQSLSGIPLVANAVISWPADEPLYASSNGGTVSVLRTNATYLGAPGSGGGSAVTVKDYSEDNSTVTVATLNPVTLFTRTITNAPAGQYLINADWWLWTASTNSFGNIHFVVDGATVPGSTDSNRTPVGAVPYSRHLGVLAPHNSGDLIVSLIVTNENTNSMQFGTYPDGRYGRHVSILGPF